MSEPTDTFLRRVAAFIGENQLLAPAETAVVGVSGGADSMALLDVLSVLGHPIIAVHVNYGLRGRESDADEDLVRTFCEARGLRLLLHRTNLREEAGGDSIQVAARRIRYRQFVRAARAHGARTVAVGHHADDQAETVLLNLFRGTGPEGLAGMPAQRPLSDSTALVRPLLFAGRDEIERYLIEREIGWRQDASNADETYRRGFIRNRLLPVIREEFGDGVTQRVNRAAQLLRQYVDASLRPELEIRFSRCLAEEDHTLGVDALRSEPEVWRRRILLEGLRRWLPAAPASTKAVVRLERLLESQPGRRVSAGGGAVWRDRDGLRFVGPPAPIDPATIDRPGEAASLAPGTFAIQMVSSHVPAPRGDPQVECVDMDRIRFPLTIRPWRHGDRLQPLGMAGTRLVSDLITDRKVPPSRRDEVLVVEDQEGIVWVVGHRLDERVRVRPTSRRVGRLSFSPAT